MAKHNLKDILTTLKALSALVPKDNATLFRLAAVTAVFTVLYILLN